MSFKLDAYCGLYCGGCFILNAYRQNRTNCLPKAWVSSIHDKEIKCHGCKSEILFENCRSCNIRECTQSKNIKFCSECSEYPCEKIKRIEKFNLAHHNVTSYSFKEIRKLGVLKWLQQQEKRWLCPNCGTPFSWYENNCFKCGSELFNSIKEEKMLKKISNTSV